MSCCLSPGTHSLLRCLIFGLRWKRVGVHDREFRGAWFVGIDGRCVTCAKACDEGDEELEARRVHQNYTIAAFDRPILHDASSDGTGLGIELPRGKADGTTRLESWDGGVVEARKERWIL